jgi:hypothetical protein
MPVRSNQHKRQKTDSASETEQPRLSELLHHAHHLSRLRDIRGDDRKASVSAFVQARPSRR